jgi:hypothetical protein
MRTAFFPRIDPSTMIDRAMAARAYLIDRLVLMAKGRWIFATSRYLTRAAKGRGGPAPSIIPRRLSVETLF